MSEATVDATVDNSRRTWLITSAAMGGVGAAAVAVPFVSSFQPSERAKAAGAAVEVDISALQPGEKSSRNGAASPCGSCAAPSSNSKIWRSSTLRWPIPSERKNVPTPEYAQNRHRSIKPEVFVGRGHLHPPGLLAR